MRIKYLNNEHGDLETLTRRDFREYHDGRIKLRLHTAINRADFVSLRMWFNGLPTKAYCHFLTNAFCYLVRVHNMHQDTKSARLIAVCKRTLVKTSWIRARC